MRLLLIISLLLLQFFAARASEAGAPTRSKGMGKAGEARFYATVKGSNAAAWNLLPAPGIKTTTVLRVTAPAGSLPGEAFILKPQAQSGGPTPLLHREVHGIPISLRLLFPGHYFW